MKSSPLLGESRARLVSSLFGHIVLAILVELSLGATEAALSPAARVVRYLGLVILLFAIHVVAMRCLSGYRERERKGHGVLLALMIFGAVAVSVGLPLDDSGQTTDICEMVEAFVRRISKRSTIPIVYVDEAFSSLEAAEKLRQGARKAESLDAYAACLILTRYFDINPVKPQNS